MLCPYCSHTDTKVTDKRDLSGITRRRRECLKCAKRFSTRENVEWSEMRVVKKDGRREAFSRDKIKAGIMRACEKRPVAIEKIDKMVDSIEEKLRSKGKEIKTEVIGKMVMNRLKKIDNIAYVRFASVYMNFQDIKDFKEVVK